MVPKKMIKDQPVLEGTDSQVSDAMFSVMYKHIQPSLSDFIIKSQRLWGVLTSFTILQCSTQKYSQLRSQMPTQYLQRSARAAVPRPPRFELELFLRHATWAKWDAGRSIRFPILNDDEFWVSRPNIVLQRHNMPVLNRFVTSFELDR